LLNGRADLSGEMRWTQLSQQRTADLKVQNPARVCSTSHATQGATVDRVLVNVDSSRSEELVNRKQFYTSISRARYNATIYTNDQQAMRRAVMRNQQKENGLEAVTPKQTASVSATVSPSPLPSPQTPQHQQSRQRGFGFRLSLGGGA
jgi:Viral (Superfamily 1) RNA helicase